MAVLVTGGAGYIGSHVVRLLQSRGQQVVVVDDLSSGVRERVATARLAQMDLADPDGRRQLREVIRTHAVEAVIHLAARKRVDESVIRPGWYYRQNLGSLLTVLDAMRATGLDRLVFSSSAAVYGAPQMGPITEEAPCGPINPYGQTKLVGEWATTNAAVAWGLHCVALRYFNVAGAGWPDLRDTAALNLVPIIYQRLAAGLPPLVYGDTYPTPDGTCVRDYVSVLDVARAHLDALDALDGPGLRHHVFNVGTGTGSSVLEVIAAIAQGVGHAVTPQVEPPRPGDPARLVADVTRIADELGWTARHDLADIVASAHG